MADTQVPGLADCACRRAEGFEHFRSHSPLSCGVLFPEETEILLAAVKEDRPLTLAEAKRLEELYNGGQG